MKLKTVEIRGRKIDVHIDGSGEFSAEYNGQELTAANLPVLHEKLERAVKSAKVSIPFIQWDGEKLKRGEATGIHYGNGNLLIKWKGEKGIEQVYGMRDALEPEHFNAYSLLCDAVEIAEKRRKEFEQKYGFDDLKERVKEALTALDGAG